MQKPTETENALQQTPGPLLEAIDLTREVDGKCLVDRVSLRVERGDVVALVGPSGAGKSSFLRLLNRLDEPSEGTVYLRGRDYRQIDPQHLRQQVGMVLQRPFLFPGTVAENLRFGPRQRGETLADDDLNALLEQVSLPGYAERQAGTLSGGEAQRVSLARTLANRPEVLLLDEPTSSLDEASEREVEALLQRILEHKQLACLMVTHDPAQAKRLAGRAIVLEQGRVVRAGRVEEVLDAR